ncbi:hypothetical protein M1N85_02950 [Dehalococcoidia bacterium]|nr:hypothetical protein [Dehalococcoidia bacterium]
MIVGSGGGAGGVTCSAPVKVLEARCRSPASILPLLLTSSTRETSRLYLPGGASAAITNERWTALEPETMATWRSLAGSLRGDLPGNWMLAPNRTVLVGPGFATLYAMVIVSPAAAVLGDG